MSQVVAIYARVSSDQQAEAGTIASQIAALREHVEQDGCTLLDDMMFIDEGYSGATLVRPSLERLRDLVAAHGLDRLYVHSPDRLARKYAYQVLLVDELQSAGVQWCFSIDNSEKQRKTTFCCRFKALWLSTSGPRSWSEADVANAILHALGT